MIMERYPKTNGIVGCLIPICDYPFYLMEKLHNKMAACLLCPPPQLYIYIHKSFGVRWGVLSLFFVPLVGGRGSLVPCSLGDKHTKR